MEEEIQWTSMAKNNTQKVSISFISFFVINSIGKWAKIRHYVDQSIYYCLHLYTLIQLGLLVDEYSHTHTYTHFKNHSNIEINDFNVTPHHLGQSVYTSLLSSAHQQVFDIRLTNTRLFLVE